MVKMHNYCAVIDGVELTLKKPDYDFLLDLVSFGFFREVGDGFFKTVPLRSTLNKIGMNPNQILSRESSAPLTQQLESESSVCLAASLTRYFSQLAGNLSTDSEVFRVHLVLQLLARYMSESQEDIEGLRKLSEVWREAPARFDSIERSEDLNSFSYELGELSTHVKKKMKTEKIPSRCVDDTPPEILSLAQEWFNWNQKQEPWIKRRKNSKRLVSTETYAKDIIKIGRETDLNLEGLNALFKFIKEDKFWSELSCSPSYLLTTSQNGRRKIDGILLKLKKKLDKANPWAVIDNPTWENPFDI
jgi:hypothetical protein